MKRTAAGAAKSPGGRRTSEPPYFDGCRIAFWARHGVEVQQQRAADLGGIVQPALVARDGSLATHVVVPADMTRAQAAAHPDLRAWAGCAPGAGHAGSWLWRPAPLASSRRQRAALLPCPSALACPLPAQAVGGGALGAAPAAGRGVCR